MSSRKSWIRDHPAGDLISKDIEAFFIQNGRSFDNMPAPDQFYNKYLHLFEDVAGKNRNWQANVRNFIYRKRDDLLKSKLSKLVMLLETCFSHTMITALDGIREGRVDFHSPKLANDETGKITRKPTANSAAFIQRPDSTVKNICINQDESDSGIFFTNPEVCEISNRTYAFYSLEVNSAIDKVEAIISNDGLECTLKFTPPKYLYHPNTVVGRKLGNGNVLHESISSWKKTKKSHKSSDISYQIVLKLPFVAKRDTNADFLAESNYSGTDLLTHKIKNDADTATNFTKSLLLIFEEEESNFNAETNASTFAFYAEDCDY